MKWERISAIVLVVLILVLVMRVVYFRSEKADILRVFIDVSEPYYPVYFGSPNGELLEPELRRGIGSIEGVLTDLLVGPSMSQLVGIIPPETTILGYRRTGNIVYVNFSHHLISNHPGGSTGEIMTVYGIVNSLVALPGVEEFQFLVENQPVPTLAGHLDLRGTLRKDYAILGISLL